MQFSLATMAARKRKSRRPITFAPILTTKAQADSLAAIYLMMIEAWGRAHEILGDAYRREMARLSDANSVAKNIPENIPALITDSAEDLGATNDAIAQAINRLILELTPQLRNWAVRTEEWHRGKWVRAVLAGAQVDLDLIIGAADVRETIDAFLVRNTSLVRDISDQARGRIADAVLRGFQQRSPIAEVAKEIREAANMARARARRVAADQTVKLASALDRERQRQAGLDHWKWRHSGKLHPRLKHVERDGKLYTDKTAPEDEPGELPFCGCVRQAVLVFEGEEL
jgi:SPP1 gp7 family putative phage head morphogenesis protein